MSEKVISICNKTIAEADEILFGCGSVFRVEIGQKKSVSKGLLSTSVTHDAYGLAMCLWKELKSGKFEKIAHVKIPFDALFSFEGAIQQAKTATIKLLEGMNDKRY